MGKRMSEELWRVLSLPSTWDSSRGRSRGIYPVRHRYTRLARLLPDGNLQICGTTLRAIRSTVHHYQKFHARPGRGIKSRTVVDQLVQERANDGMGKITTLGDCAAGKKKKKKKKRSSFRGCRWRLMILPGSQFFHYSVCSFTLNSPRLDHFV